MKTKLLTICLLLFASQLSYGDDKIISCYIKGHEKTLYKYVKSFFKDNIFSGLIDFYFACHDFLAYDIAITINAWCFDNKGKFDNVKFQSLIAGYQVNRSLNQNEKQSMPILLRGAAIRYLITRLYDQLYHPADAFVIPKNPLEYFSILQFHQAHNFFEANI